MATRERIIVNKNFPQLRPTIQQVTRHGFPAGSVIIYKERRNELRCFPAAGAEVNVKSFKLPNFPNNYIYRTFRKSKARRSYENAMELQRLGFLTPDPFGYSELHLGIGSKGFGLWPKLTKSYYFCRQEPYVNARDWEQRPDIDRFLPAFAAEMARLHEKGVWFHDFSPGNILIRETNQGNYEFYYVDVNRTDFNVHDPSRLMQMFKSISWHDAWVEKLARAYALAAGKDPEPTAQAALEEAHRYRQRYDRKDRWKKLLGIKKRQEEERRRIQESLK